MARRSGAGNEEDGGVVDYRHPGAKRKNIPPAGLAGSGNIARERKLEYGYNPHLPPTLRFDPTGAADSLPELIAEAGKRPLTPAEQRALADALRNHQPWLEWTGKREEQACVVDPVALHIHERVSAQAILKMAAREDVQRSLFADPEQELREALQFYQHDVHWSNRMILGDSLAVMASLARREGLAGKVQMIYCDFPYGIKYASNFQSEVRNATVKDRPEDLTREPEMVKAYRDTWTLGIHSYLQYARDRLVLARELLSDTGSVFLQIGEENLHRLRAICDEVFGAENFIALLTYKSKKMPLGETFIFTVNDYILWYAKDRSRATFRRLYSDRAAGADSAYSYIKSPTGEFRSVRDGEEEDLERYGCRTLDLRSAGRTESCVFDVEFNGRTYVPSAGRSWKTNSSGMERLARAERLLAPGASLQYLLMHSDYPVSELPNVWMDSQGASDKRYVVQTPDKIIQRCLLMTTDPGDLVLDPTLGSGTTAYVAEQLGRRWIGIDVSRVSLAISRQRLISSTFDYYQLRGTSAGDMGRNPDGPWLRDQIGAVPGPCTFNCRTVPHVTLKSIAQNQALDQVLDRWAPRLAEKLAQLNGVLADVVSADLRQALLINARASLTEVQRRRIGDDLPKLRAALPGDVWRRLMMPPDNRPDRPYETVQNDFPGWYEWEVPFEADPLWPEPLAQALADYRAAWRQKMDEVNRTIAARAEQEELVDQPVVVRNVTRVSGPFTVEGVIPVEESIDLEAPRPVDHMDEAMSTFERCGEAGADVAADTTNAETYVDKLLGLLRSDGVRFPDNKVVKFSRLERYRSAGFHGEGQWEIDGAERVVAVLLGPQYGPMTAGMVEDALRFANRRGFDDVVFAGFTFDGAAQAVIQEESVGNLRLHMAQIRPDVNMGDLLKTTVSSQLFTVSGTPRVRIHDRPNGEVEVEMQGVDIYDPVSNAVRSAGADKVAAWFIDGNYDGRTFCITQAFFPDRDAWTKLSRALSGKVDPDVFDTFSGTRSLPFKPGKHVAVKVIDPRGNEVMWVRRTDGCY